ncbi:ketopantoate hydroxymethyltransferase [Candidatus Thermokryptus mobilis]|uniref:3-methyl-2-oxobutanoate hydroxymethyltransferase n=1 Tax=Candidatus Thermokryptus mobilis TaxID=1643428 RepID=A0A0S4NBF3_9BACT|nr:3-methyl-2-oxobutanoate hydroxymethyltransferase [Candidatus Thermokryptus mobilis]CUU08187.1 ketopantoate hydroxymethyltransferase [Candidatus Thermokryptus mobilis]
MKKVTTKKLLEMKERGEKIAMLTAYDFLIAKLLDEAGIDVILVGDSLGNVFQGHATTLPVTLDDMIYHTKAVCRGVKRAMVIVDMPFLSYQVSIEEAVKNCGRVLKETCAEGVKLEGGSEIIEVVSKLTSIGIPVMGHLGLTPQSIHKFGGYDVRGVDESEAKKILNDAIELEKAGAFAIVLEKIPAELAKRVTESVKIPTIGIGAGPHCDGQVLVVYDMLGLFEEFKPKFVRRYAELAKVIKSAFENYIADVKSGKFPAEGEFY